MKIKPKKICPESSPMAVSGKNIIKKGIKKAKKKNINFTISSTPKKLLFTSYNIAFYVLCENRKRAFPLWESP